MGIEVFRAFLVGICAAVPAGPVLLLVLQKTLSRGRGAGILTGLGSAFADTLFATVGLFTLSLVDDFITRHETVIMEVGGVLMLLIYCGLGFVGVVTAAYMPEAENLILYGADRGLKISGLLVCGVLISALGAVMDVALGIASSVWELREQNPALSAKELFGSGMHIGRDAMGTMANTLILAFAGSSLNMLLLVQTYDIPFIQLINTDYICIEVIQSIAGAMGILLTVPIVAFISAALMAGRKTRVVANKSSK